MFKLEDVREKEAWEAGASPASASFPQGQRVCPDPGHISIALYTRDRPFSLSLPCSVFQKDENIR